MDEKWKRHVGIWLKILIENISVCVYMHMYYIYPKYVCFE